MMNKNIALVGFMGAGKTVVAKNLAKSLNRKLVLTDAIIVSKEKKPIVDIFRDSGEPHFRKVEKEVVAEVSQKENLIIDCGGGIVLDQDNIDNLKRNGIIIYLCASPDVIYNRVRNQKQRPLLNVPDPKKAIEGLLAIRKDRYALADHTVNTDRKSVKEVVNEILTLVSND